MPDKFVCYFRVSTRRQGASGLGLDAQRTTVRSYLDRVGNGVLGEFTEIESGKDDENRPQLQAALALCRLTGARLLVSTLNRLSRDAAFLMRLLKESAEDDGVKFTCCDMPEANELSIGMLAVAAQHERKTIVKQVTDALAAAKARGKKKDGTRFKTASGKLGPTPAGIAAIMQHGDRGRALAAKSLRKKADAFARRVGAKLLEFQAAGITTQVALAAELNRKEVRTRRKQGPWTQGQVSRVLARMRTLS